MLVGKNASFKEKDNLCLYGLPNETWEVNLPVEEVPPELPEPALGINFARDGMQEKDWLSLVAVHSDSWLIGVAFYFGARFGFGKSERSTFTATFLGSYICEKIALPHDRKWIATEAFLPTVLPRRGPDPSQAFAKLRAGSLMGPRFTMARKRLFQMINDVPTVYEVVTASAKQPKDQSGAQNNGSKSKSSVKTSQPKGVKMMTPPKQENGNGEEEEEDEQGATCGACGDNYANDEFWICCDVCERWFHGKCVKITPAKAEHIKQYKCPSCSNKRARV
ncbi:hypothetical protein RHGRI_014238 [Rhododendron griersonianum]|uniref:PHD finger protein ALFIN-LIKE n=1 Tax=Rhododendron griersonianum TaxID=479676 RepID=A0AAV6K8N1_9ERIC|nr:hypothetical protein RHGRI_014238 [Rhododendron griersonianum]